MSLLLCRQESPRAPSANLRPLPNSKYRSLLLTGPPLSFLSTKTLYILRRLANFQGSLQGILYLKNLGGGGSRLERPMFLEIFVYRKWEDLLVLVFFFVLLQVFCDFLKFFPQTWISLLDLHFCLTGTLHCVFQWFLLFTGPVWIKVRYKPFNENPRSQFCQITGNEIQLCFFKVFPDVYNFFPQIWKRQHNLCD